MPILEEHPELIYERLADSIGDFILTLYPDAAIYTNPVKASMHMPRWFIFFYGDQAIKKEIDHTALKTINVDVIYEEDFNKENLYDEYQKVSENIENHINNLAYNVKDEEWEEILYSVPINALDFKSNWNQTGLHCKFTLKLRIIEKDIVDGTIDKIKRVSWEIDTKEEANG